MALGDLVFLVAQAVGVVEDLPRRVELADVMNHCGGLDLGDVDGREMHRARYPRRVSCDALAVSMGVGVPRFEQPAEPCQELDAHRRTRLAGGVEQGARLGEAP